MSEVGLDPNDFPALGSTPATSASVPSNTNSASNGGGTGTATSYASQAGTGVPLGSGNGQGGGSSQPRDFTPDDFPALGGASQQQPQLPQQQSAQTPGQESHPPGLNGLHSDQQRQSLLGSLSGSLASQQQGQLHTGQQQQPGLLNLSSRGSVIPGLQPETEKQRVCCR